jgi:4-aminobutyrate aminotransferase-like enzyme
MSQGIDYFKGFREIQIEDIPLKKKKEKKKPKYVYAPYNPDYHNKPYTSQGDIPYNRNYKERLMADKDKELHRKLLKYPTELHESMKDFLNSPICSELGIVNLNEMFIFAVNKLIKEHE